MDDNVKQESGEELDIATSDMLLTSQEITDSAKSAEPLPCSECGKTFGNRRLLNAHKKRHVKWDAAAAIGEETADASPSDDSSATQRTPTPAAYKPKWRCTFRPKKFELKNNTGTDTGESPFPGDIESFIRRGTRERPFRCKICSHCLATRESLAKHVMGHLAKPDEPQSCDECGKTFASLKLFKVHKKRHDAKRAAATVDDPNAPPYVDDRKWQCSFCPKKFKYKHPLMVHERTHTGEKPLACRFCDRKFRHQSALAMHEKRHTDDRRYECETCQKRFLQMGDLRIHIRTHSGEKPYQCNVCSKSFPREASFRRHRLLHLRSDDPSGINCQNIPAGTSDAEQTSSLNEDSTLESTQLQPTEKLIKDGYPCTNCGRIFAYRSALKDHMRTHTGEKAFQCTLCSKKFGYKHSLNTHLRSHIGEKHYKCSYCDESFVHHNTKHSHEITKHINPAAYACPMCPKVLTSASGLQTHKQTHGERRFQCPKCPKKFTLKRYIQPHMEKMHANEDAGQHRCPECGQVFDFPAFLATHMKTHSGLKPYKCRTCSKEYASKGSMRNHERTHLGIRPFACKVCGRAFVYLSQLTHHEDSHSAKRPSSSKLTCKHCNKKFDYRYHLRAHLRLHAVRPFKCQYCYKCYGSKNNLLIHERLHTNERPFQCRACDKRFAQKAHLNYHLKCCKKLDVIEQRSSPDAADASFTSSMEAFINGESSDSPASGIDSSVIDDTIEADQQEEDVCFTDSLINASEFPSQVYDPMSVSSAMITDTNDSTEQQQRERIRSRKRKPTKKLGDVLPVSGKDDQAINDILMAVAQRAINSNSNNDFPAEDPFISAESPRDCFEDELND